MSFDYELEDILNSVKKNGDGDGNEKMSNGDEIKTQEPLEPPKKRKESPDEEKSEPVKEEKTEKAVKNKINVSFEPPKLLKDFFKKLGDFGWKKIGIIACAVLVVIVGVFAAVKISDYAKTAYIRKYEKIYKIDFPDGIAEKFCDEYGKNQSVVGRITSDDAKLDGVMVYSKYRKGKALLEKGSDIYHAQHIRAISLDENVGDIESAYKTPAAFLSSSQKIKFETLFGDEEYRVVAAYYTNTNPKDDDGYVFPYNTYGTLTKKSFYHYQDRIKSRRLYDTGFKLLEQNYILSISAPSDFMKDFRFVIVCVKTEDKFEKANKAEPNKRIHYPQVWYDKNKQKNPFYLAGDWYPEIVVDSNSTTKQLTRKDFE